MKPLLFAVLLWPTLRAQSLPVVPLRTTDPEQLARSLREKGPVTREDCAALDLWECHPNEPRRAAAVALRWTQLDDDPELEAILLTEAMAENTSVAHVFDKRGTWNLVGRFFDRQWTFNGQTMVQVGRLTADSPPLLSVTRDRGGSGAVIITTESFHLRGGKLWPALTIFDMEEAAFPSPTLRRQQVRAVGVHLVIATTHEEPPGRTVRSDCEVRRWDRARYTFAPDPAARREHCDPKSTRPRPPR